jgi:hypothetical protein
MLRLILLFLLFVFVVRALWRLLGGIVDGIAAQPRGGPPGRGVEMARDPVCGTYVVPDRAVTLTVGTNLLHFCSPACRDKYRARTA